MNYLLTGGTGYVGRHFIASLDYNQDTVIVLTRSNPVLPAFCRAVNSLDELAADIPIDVVINLAGSRIDRRWTPKVKKDLLDSRINTTQAVIELIGRLTVRPKVMLSASAIGYYGGLTGQKIDETTEPQPGFTHDLCQQWEAVASQAKGQGVRVCLLRLGVVLGKGSGFINNVGLPFKLGLGGMLGDGEQGFAWIHIDDVIAVMHWLIKQQVCEGAYNLVAPEVVSNRLLTEVMASIVKRPAFFHMPSPVVRLLFGEMGEELLLKGNHIAPARLVEAGYRFKYSQIRPALTDVFAGR